MKYGYRVEKFGGGYLEKTLEKVLNDWGQEGWKVISMAERSDVNGDSAGLTIILMKEVDDFGEPG